MPISQPHPSPAIRAFLSKHTQPGTSRFGVLSKQDFGLLKHIPTNAGCWRELANVGQEPLDAADKWFCARGMKLKKKLA
eukprot:1148937-Pelagomonas_calceolata.AAC.11